jgi:hypothetical protein
VIVEVCVPSRIESFTPVTVTLWGIFQLALVNVNAAGLTVASPMSPLKMVNTTFEAGWAVRTTEKVSVVALSLTDVLPPVGVTVKSATSLSVVVTEIVLSGSGS